MKGVVSSPDGSSSGAGRRSRPEAEGEPVRAGEQAGASAHPWQVYRRRWSVIALVVLSVMLAGQLSGFEPGRVAGIAALDGFRDTLAGFLRPDLGAEHVARVAALTVESLLIGALGTSLALILGVVLALGAARVPLLVEPPGARGVRVAVGAGLAMVTRFLARALLSFFRSVPDIVWAFLFVRIVGLGPGAAILAIALNCGGILGKLYAELLEAADPAPARALRAGGAGWFAVVVHGVFPLVRSQWIAYGAFRLECSIRSATVLGVVGAGGLGQEIAISIRYYQLDKLATALLFVLGLMVVLEVGSGYLHRMRARTAVALLGLLGLLGVVHLAVPWSDLFTAEALEQAGRFAAGFGDPTVEGGFLWRAVGLVMLTVGMAWVATALAGGVAMVLAPLATPRLSLRSAIPDGPSGPGQSFLVRLVPAVVLILARGIAQVSRAVPELLWALIFVLWVGPGVTAGVLAVAVHTVGILARLYTDIFEQAESEALRALESAGATRLGRLIHGVMPYVSPRLLSYTLYRFEVNIRATATVGFVGAGGLGDALHTALSLFHMNDLAALLVILFVVVVAVDSAGSWVRGRLLAAR